MRYCLPPALLALAACGSIERTEQLPQADAPSASGIEAATALPTPSPTPSIGVAPMAAPGGDAPLPQPMTAADLAAGGVRGAGCTFATAEGAMLAVTPDRAIARVAGAVAAFDVPPGDLASVEAGPTLTSDTLIARVEREGGEGAARSWPATMTIEAVGGTGRTLRGEWRCADTVSIARVG
ncbi:hypothetical protein [Sphingomonas baiyangensis]|uniref:hypothetical protein n=1 Tax=Sphingomonas baiyangensis TaxID=2572576 RepID=UPI00146B9076|nr:hypothetical protein [Sphingomonas baiyangensis]